MSNTISYETTTYSSHGQLGSWMDPDRSKTNYADLFWRQTALTSPQESRSRRVQSVYRKLLWLWGSSGWMGYTVATVHSPHMSVGPQVELTPVLTARHDPLWGNSVETVFHYDFVCVFLLHINCQFRVAQASLCFYGYKEGRGHMQRAGQAPLLWSVNNILIPVSVVVVVWHKRSSTLHF